MKYYIDADGFVTKSIPNEYRVEPTVFPQVVPRKKHIKKLRSVSSKPEKMKWSATNSGGMGEFFKGRGASKPKGMNNSIVPDYPEDDLDKLIKAPKLLEPPAEMGFVIINTMTRKWQRVQKLTPELYVALSNMPDIRIIP